MTSRKEPSFVGQVVRIALGVFIGVMLAFIVILIWNRHHPSVFVPINVTHESTSSSLEEAQVSEGEGSVEEVELPNGEIIKGENAHIPPVLQEEEEAEAAAERTNRAENERGGFTPQEDEEARTEGGGVQRE